MISGKPCTKVNVVVGIGAAALSRPIIKMDTTSSEKNLFMLASLLR
jgi:hypothetical protein